MGIMVGMMVVMVMGMMVVVIKAERGLIRMSEARKKGEEKKASTPSLHPSGDLDNPPRLP